MDADAEITASTMARLLGRAETAEAHCDAAIRILRLLVARVRRTGGHAWPEEQSALWEAEALLVEARR